MEKQNKKRKKTAPALFCAAMVMNASSFCDQVDQEPQSLKMNLRENSPKSSALVIPMLFHQFVCLDWLS